MPNPPSQTDTGQKWLENFQDKELPYGRMLLDSLDIPSEDSARLGIAEMIAEVVSNSKFPVLLMPVQALEDLFDKSGKKIQKKDRGNKVAYQDFDPHQAISPTPGSEGFVGSVVRESIRENNAVFGKGSIFGPELSIEKMREKKVRRICFVADNMGSGEQARDFIGSFMLNRTFRSWKSYRLLNFSLAVLGSTAESRGRIHHSVDIHSKLESPTIYSVDWEESDRNKVIDICNKYGRRQKLGYGDSGGLFVPSVSSVPNNLPHILRRVDPSEDNPQSKKWKPFFEERVFPVKLRDEISGWSPIQDLPSVLHKLGDANLARLVSSREYSGAPAEMISLLALIYREPSKTESQTALSLHISLQRYRELVSYLTRTGALTQEGKLTREGLKLLRVSNKFVRGRAWPPVAQVADWYYPKELR